MPHETLNVAQVSAAYANILLGFLIQQSVPLVCLSDIFLHQLYSNDCVSNVSGEFVLFLNVLVRDSRPKPVSALMSKASFLYVKEYTRDCVFIAADVWDCCDCFLGQQNALNQASVP